MVARMRNGKALVRGATFGMFFALWLAVSAILFLTDKER